MKSYLKPIYWALITITLLSSCAQEDEPTPTGELKVLVRNSNGAGDNTAMSILWVWPIEETGWHVESALELLNSDWARDTRNVPYPSAHRIERFTGVFQLQLEPGQYLVATMLTEAPQGRYSYTTVAVEAGQQTTVTKVFTGVEDYSYENW
ncbi:hypothetical protein [Roseivirga sp. UBA838]|uniref:hypothetical protein n=1 Tax=Roseivirga sp. UBA838 TaxID=1947393 RepID=UPI00257B7B60|nr:hypothetical protein [Roseivirga sp. UBA838]|tara:strand:+ start:507 stop:959 length:453 start_codon:yes stop_codon:yes gene_type:complete